MITVPSLVPDWAIQHYETYIDDLRKVRDEQRALLRTDSMRARLDDIEAELTYLLIRARRPDTVVELGALDGWSTTWILRALRDNGAGRLITMDLRANAAFLVPPQLATGRWNFRAGNARGLPMDWVAQADHVFIDAEHTATFARWYVRDVLSHLAPGTWVSVHDVFHKAHPSREGAVVLNWLATQNIPYFTAARAAAPEAYERIMGLRRKLGVTEPIHSARRNPMVFFQITGVAGGSGRRE